VTTNYYHLPHGSGIGTLPLRLSLVASLVQPCHSNRSNHLPICLKTFFIHLITFAHSLCSCSFQLPSLSGSQLSRFAAGALGRRNWSIPDTYLARAPASCRLPTVRRPFNRVSRPFRPAHLPSTPRRQSLTTCVLPSTWSQRTPSLRHVYRLDWRTDAGQNYGCKKRSRRPQGQNQAEEG